MLVKSPVMYNVGWVSNISGLLLQMQLGLLHTTARVTFVTRGLRDNTRHVGELLVVCSTIFICMRRGERRDSWLKLQLIYSTYTA